MKRSPQKHLVEILAMLFPAKSKGRQRCAPFNASVAPLSDNDQLSAAPTGAMVCSVTRLGVHLLHAEPLDCRRLMIAVTIDSGEVLRMIVAVRSTSRQGGRYKTIARFLTTESPQGEE